MADLISLALQIGYELDSMVRMALRIGTTDGDSVVENALLEATLLHCRNLIEFLTGNPRGDDITPHDFVGGWDPASAQIPPGVAKALHKHLAHLTKTRVTDGKVGWDFPLLVVTILDSMRRFIERCEATGDPAAASVLRNHLTVVDDTIQRVMKRRRAATIGDVLCLGNFS